MEGMRVSLVRVLVLLGLTMVTEMAMVMTMVMAMEAAMGMATATEMAAHGRLGDLLVGGDRL
jgi:hypothetical protein